MEAIVPSPDLLPVPAPIWLVEFLLVFTFIAHVIPMNFLFGGGLLAALSHARGGKDAHHLRLSRRIFELLPVVIAFAVTLGVAPLLFVQVLYGQFVYSSSILMANAWFGVVPLVIIAYYLAYLLKFKWDDLTGMRSGLAWAMAVVFAIVGFIYSNNFSLMLRPDTWAAHYFADTASGSLNWSDAMLYPRYLHMLLGAVAVGGVWIVILGLRRRSEDAVWSEWAVRYGAKIFMHTTLLNVLMGLWFLLALPKRVMMIFMGKNPVATLLLVAGLVLAAAGWLFMRRASKSSNPGAPAVAGMLTLILLLGVMAIMRHQVRTAFLDPYFRLDQLKVVPQWDVFAVFAATLAIGLAVVVWLIRVALRAKPAHA